MGVYGKTRVIFIVSVAAFSHNYVLSLLALMTYLRSSVMSPGLRVIRSFLLARRRMPLSCVMQIPEPGQLVDVRHRRYVVVEVTASTLPPPILSTGTLSLQQMVTLSSVEDDAFGEDLQVIWEVEPGAMAIEKTPLPVPVGFDALSSATIWPSSQKLKAETSNWYFR